MSCTSVLYPPLVWLAKKARYHANSTQHMFSDYLADEIQIVRR
jgi:hypothetical protein